VNTLTDGATKSTKDPRTKWNSNLRSSRLLCEMLQNLLIIKCDRIYYFLHIIVVTSEASFLGTILHIMTLFRAEGNKT
jgi:hypothetical protein